jgi:hypothetical protein
MSDEFLPTEIALTDFVSTYLARRSRAPDDNESEGFSYPEVTTRQWDGDPMDWESWPTGRPGPFVLEAEMEKLMILSSFLEQVRDEESRTEEKVFHIAEFSLFGQGEFHVHGSRSGLTNRIRPETFQGHVTESELVVSIGYL